MHNTDPFIIALTALLAGVCLSRIVADYQLRQLKSKHAEELESVKVWSRREREGIEEQNRRQILQLVKAAYTAGEKDARDGKPCSCSAV